MDSSNKDEARSTGDNGKGKSVESERSDGISLVDFKLPQRSALVVAMPCATESPESALEALGGYEWRTCPGKVREAYNRALDQNNVGDITSLNCYLEPRPKGRHPSSTNMLERESRGTKGGIVVSTWSHPLTGEFKNSCGFVLRIAKKVGAPSGNFSCNVLAHTEKKVCFSGLADFRVTHRDRIRSWEEYWSELELLKSTLGRDTIGGEKTTWTEQSIEKMTVPLTLPVSSSNDIPVELPLVQSENGSSAVLTRSRVQSIEQILNMHPEERLREMLQRVETKYSGLRQKDRSHIRESPSTLIDQGPVVELPRETVQNPESSEIRITGRHAEESDGAEPHEQDAAAAAAAAVSVGANLEREENDDGQANDEQASDEEQTNNVPAAHAGSTQPENLPKKKKRNMSKEEKVGIIIQNMLTGDQEKEILASPSNAVWDWSNAPIAIKKVLEPPPSSSATVIKSDKHGEITQTFRRSFQERPIFSGLMLRLRLPDPFRKIDNSVFSYLAKDFSEFSAAGPWKRCYIRKGYDPWKSLEVRLPQQWLKKEEERTKGKSNLLQIKNERTLSGKKKRDRTWGRLASGKVTVKDPFRLSFVRSFMLFQVIDVLVQSREIRTLIERPGAVLSSPTDHSGWLHPYVMQIIRDAALYLIGEKKDLLGAAQRSIGTFNLDMKFSEIDFNEPKFQDGWM